jgi:hypothetical protein
MAWLATVSTASCALFNVLMVFLAPCCLNARQFWRLAKIVEVSQVVYVVLAERLCTTGFVPHLLRGKFADPFSFDRKCLFFRFFYRCTKIEHLCFSSETAVYIGSTIISSPELSTGRGALRALSQDQEITRCKRGFAEGSEANRIPLLGEEKGSIEYQPKLQWASEKSAQ